VTVLGRGWLRPAVEDLRKGAWGQNGNALIGSHVHEELITA